jgi:hypothetical protein
MSRPNGGGRAPPGYRWVRCRKVWHVRKKAFIRRKDGRDFVFLVRDRRR